MGLAMTCYIQYNYVRLVQAVKAGGNQYLEKEAGNRSQRLYGFC
jgi:hypothetical protein